MLKERAIQVSGLIFVVNINKAAVHLWQQFGFKTAGGTPKGFRHKELGLVDTYNMFKDLQAY
ncbi:hypothetical protein A8C56_12050 [Niabella ginsenosidivorans]|uniref:N-acetyltransferase domain-containing protein n=1 Tax=Niabella ginsenosidivorans TaxID=1176587 RepID=A0A1A9I4K6_9BACT|nr:hypothetical protein A8C56_12050 [Niabella ginsenosidivorans]